MGQHLPSSDQIYLQKSFLPPLQMSLRQDRKPVVLHNDIFRVLHLLIIRSGRVNRCIGIKLEELLVVLLKVFEKLGILFSEL